jgi:hypothetical protein
MATFCVEIADDAVERVITAMCVNYRYQAIIANPAYDPMLDPPDPDIPPTIPNPETTHQFANRMTRDYLINNTHAYEVKKAKEDAAGNVPAPPSVVDPDNP